MNYFQVETTFEFEYQTRFSREFMIQYISTLLMYECDQILFHVTHVMMVLIVIHELYHDSECKTLK